MGMLATMRARAALYLANVAEKVASPGILKRAPRTLSGVDDSRGWWSLFSSMARHVGFQSDTVKSRDSILAQVTVFSCHTQIASDIGKLRAKLVELTGGIWVEITSSAFSPVLRKPNHFQTWQLFVEQWVHSLLSSGNTYILKVRDNRKVVIALYVLDPSRCRPLVANNGEVYYELQEDDLSKVHEARTSENAVPASEIVHGRINCIFHPLVGLSPIFANGLAASQALNIQNNSSKFFENMSQPGGVLTAPGEISDENALRAKEYWEQNFTGANAGKVAVLGDGLTYTPMTIKPVDAQLVDQMKLSAEQICGTYHVPAYMVGAGPVPAASNIESLRLDYYQRCLQSIIEGIENSLDDGLGLGIMKDGRTFGVELDLDALLRMDSKTLAEVESIKVGSAISKPDESRRKFNLPPVEGGDACYLQQQNFSLAALAKRDAGADPFRTSKPEPSAPPAANDGADGAAAKAAAQALRAEAVALERRIAATELWAREADGRRAAEDLQRADESRRLAAEQSATVQRLLESIPTAVAEAVTKSAPMTETRDTDDDFDIEEFAAHFEALEPISA